MKKKILLLLLLLVAVVGLWIWYASRTTNPTNAATVGDISTPIGYTRVEAAPGSFGHYLRNLPLRPRGTKVQLYTGGRANFQFLAAAVIDLPLLSNFEQCADATLRLRAEYLWSQGQYRKIRFQNVNGKALRYQGGGSRSSLEGYLKRAYGECSTFSVFRETEPRPLNQIQPGDVLVYPARPGQKYGHAMLVADVAKNSSKKIAILCIEGNTPARDLHLVRNLNPLSNPWFFMDTDAETHYISLFKFNTPEFRYYP